MSPRESGGPTPKEMGIIPEASTGTEFITDEALIKDCLTDKRIGFNELSELGIDELLRQAPHGETFTVPKNINKKMYETKAKALDRKDLRFIVEK